MDATYFFFLPHHRPLLSIDCNLCCLCLSFPCPGLQVGVHINPLGDLIVWVNGTQACGLLRLTEALLHNPRQLQALLLRHFV